MKTIRIIKASSLDREGLLARRIQELESYGFRVLFDDLQPDPAWPYCAASVESRARALTKALIEDESDAVMWARGGYGASELLERLPWSTIKQSKAKPIIGFSDVCAAQSALYAFTGRLSIHGPMAATVTWKKNGDSDVSALVALLRGDSHSGRLAVAGRPELRSVKIDGKLFGGCLSVLTALIGTPYLPKSLKGHILLFEDVGENPGRVMRMLTQWRQSGMLAGVRALVFGAFTDLGSGLPDSSPMLFDEIRRRFELPIYTSPDFGHISPNEPFVIGSEASIENNVLSWHVRPALTFA